MISPEEVGALSMTPAEVDAELAISRVPGHAPFVIHVMNEDTSAPLCGAVTGASDPTGGSVTCPICRAFQAAMATRKDDTAESYEDAEAAEVEIS